MLFGIRGIDRRNSTAGARLLRSVRELQRGVARMSEFVRQLLRRVIGNIRGKSRRISVRLPAPDNMERRFADAAGSLSA